MIDDMPILAIIAALAVGHSQLDPNIVKWRTYKDGAYSKAQSEQIRVLETPGDYERYLNELGPQGAGAGADIDWGKEELVAIHVGTRAAGGYSVEVTAITKTKPNEATVYWTEKTPIPGVAQSQAATSPWTIVRLNRPGLRLAFSGHKEEGRLPGGIQILSSPGYYRDRACCEKCAREREGQLPFRTYAQGVDAPVMMSCTVVMNSEQDFTNYRRNYNMPGLGDVSGIDWDSSRLLAIHLGRKMTPGFQILIDHVDLVDNRRVDVSYTQVEPTGQVYGAGTPRGPYLLIAIPRIGSLVTFTKRTIKDTALVGRDRCTCGCKDCKCGH